MAGGPVVTLRISSGESGGVTSLGLGLGVGSGGVGTLLRGVGCLDSAGVCGVILEDLGGVFGVLFEDTSLPDPGLNNL